MNSQKFPELEGLFVYVILDIKKNSFLTHNSKLSKVDRPRGRIRIFDTKSAAMSTSYFSKTEHLVIKLKLDIEEVIV